MANKVVKAMIYIAFCKNWSHSLNKKLLVLSSQMANAAGGETKGLPQLDVSTWPNQLLWLAITFTVGYFLMAKVITPRIGSVLDIRKQTISDDLNKSKRC